MIGKMIDSLVVAELGRQCHEVLTDPILVNPRDVPLRVGVGLDPSLGLEHVVDGVPKGRAEADRPARRPAELLVGARDVHIGKSAGGGGKERQAVGRKASLLSIRCGAAALTKKSAIALPIEES